MDPKITLTPTLRVDRIGSPQSDARSGRTPFPFARGQMLQGTITGRDSGNRFYLDVGGARFIAESGTPLRVGQQLDLQVVSTSPRTTLRVIEDPLTRDIGRSLHLLTRQDSLLPETATLAEKNVNNPDLSPQTRQTLQFFATAAAKLSTAGAPPGQPDQALAVLTARLATAAPGGSDAKQAVAGLRELLVPLARDGAGETAALAARVLRELDVLEDTRVPGPAFLVQRQTTETGQHIDLAGEPRNVLQQIDQAAFSDRAGTGPTPLLLSLFPDRETTPSRLLLLILGLHRHLATPDKSMPPDRPGGEEIRQVVDRLGLDMERLLAKGRREEAAQSLKNALLELSHTITGSREKDHAPALLLGTIELYQMLQIRLTPEGLFFLPLPLPFLHQGYLLVDEQENGDRRDGADEQAEIVHLHLQLEGLGNVQIDISRRGSGVDLRFLAQDRERAEFMQAHRGELEQWLTALRPDSISFLAGAEDPAVKLLRKMLPPGSSGILDTRA